MTALTLSAGFNFHTKFKIVLPESVLHLLQKIHALSPNKQDEFGIFLKANINLDEATVYIFPVDDSKNENFILPEQEVTPGSISFKEDAPQGYNTVIHRHPAGVTSFSGTDMNSINQEFDVSLVFIPPASFPDAIVNIRLTEDSFLQLRLKEADIEVKKKALTYTESFKELVNSKLKQRKTIYAGLPAGVSVETVVPPVNSSFPKNFGGMLGNKGKRIPFAGKKVQDRLMSQLDSLDDDEDLFNHLAQLDRQEHGF